MPTALFVGRFDPVTLGHLDIAKRAADHRQPDRRAAATGDQFFAQLLGVLAAACPAIPDREQRDEERRPPDQRNALLLDLDGFIELSLACESVAQVPVAPVEVGIIERFAARARRRSS